jgi:hypothetical protein
MIPLRIVLLSLIVITAVAHVPAFSRAVPASAEQPELARLRALLVINSAPEDLKKSVAVDRQRMEDLLARKIPAGRYEVKVFAPPQEITRQRILDYYRTLHTGPTEALLFYYAGHGVTQDNRHFLQLQPKPSSWLSRDDLRKAMEEKKPGLAIILTDCCSTVIKVPRSMTRQAFTFPTQTDPVLRCLLFRHRGTVDITASTNTPSWGDDGEGGIFTRSLDRLSDASLKQLDDNHDGFISWQEFFPRLQKETDSTFRRWATVQKARGETVPHVTQKPRAFQLPGDGAASSSVNTVFALVGLRNATDQPIPYFFRWGADAPWEGAILSPLEKRLFSRMLPSAESPLPCLDVRFGNPERILSLQPARWSGTGQPTYEHSKQYKFGGKGGSSRGMVPDPR